MVLHFVLYMELLSEHLKFSFVMFCVIVVSRSKLLSGQEVLDIMNVLDQCLITDSNDVSRLLAHTG